MAGKAFSFRHKYIEKLYLAINYLLLERAVKSMLTDLFLKMKLTSAALFSSELEGTRRG